MQSFYIDNAADLQTLCKKLETSHFLTVDTEFVRERTYYPQLALIQLGNHELSACIDPLAIDDLSPIKALFINESIPKVFHAASQDLEIFQLLFSALPTPIFDTQIVAAVLGLGDQIGYAKLAKEILNVDVDKTQTRTDWLRRPLSAQQIQYAEDDVRYLSQIYPILVQRLDDLGRTDWLKQDFQTLLDPKRYTPNPKTCWRKIKGINKLKGVQLAILQQLAAWRENLAIEKDQPRRRVIGDEHLLDMARLRPKNTEGLTKLRNININFVNRHNDALLACICQGEKMPRDQWPQLPAFTRLTQNQDAQIDALNAIVKLCAAKYKISATNLTSRKELEKLVQGERDLPILNGWRRHHGGQKLVEFLNGEKTLELCDGQIKIAIKA